MSTRPDYTPRIGARQVRKSGGSLRSRRHRTHGRYFSMLAFASAAAWASPDAGSSPRAESPPPASPLPPAVTLGSGFAAGFAACSAPRRDSRVARRDFAGFSSFTAGSGVDASSSPAAREPSSPVRLTASALPRNDPSSVPPTVPPTLPRPLDSDPPSPPVAPPPKSWASAGPASNAATAALIQTVRMFMVLLL